MKCFRIFSSILTISVTILTNYVTFKDSLIPPSASVSTIYQGDFKSYFSIRYLKVR
jgi:hypothetical protein